MIRAVDFLDSDGSVRLLPKPRAVDPVPGHEDHDEYEDEDSDEAEGDGDAGDLAAF